jgi:hypothetical protein
MKSPVVVWMVAPVVMLMVWFGTSVNSKRCNSNANATVADSIANWSPTHFRGPPLNGMYLKSVLVSLGTGPSKSNRSGMNSSALSQT